jgi:putative membrane protein
MVSYDTKWSSLANQLWLLAGNEIIKHWRCSVKFLLRLILNTGIFLLIAYLFRAIGLTFAIESFWWALLASVILGALNLFLKPILQVISLPLTLLTFGLFTLIVNGFLLWLVVLILQPHFVIPDFWVIILAAFVYAILSSLAGRLMNETK